MVCSVEKHVIDRYLSTLVVQSDFFFWLISCPLTSNCQNDRRALVNVQLICWELSVNAAYSSVQLRTSLNK